MTFETETVLDRRRMRRRLSFWRSAAIAGLALAFGLLAFGGERISDLAASHQIARVTVEGTITEDRDQLLLLKRLRDAGHVEALLVFVNSPGGTTAGGESLFQALRNVAEKKPVVAQFGTVAASAGYIVGLGTDHIVSHGNTITGSIGVLAQWPEVSALLDKIGVKVNEVKSGELKAEPSPVKPMDAGGRQGGRSLRQRCAGLWKGGFSRAGRGWSANWSTRSAARPRPCAGSRRSGALQ